MAEPERTSTGPAEAGPWYRRVELGGDHTVVDLERLTQDLAKAPWKEFDQQVFDFRSHHGQLPAGAEPVRHYVEDQVLPVLQNLEIVAANDPQLARQLWVDNVPDQRPLPRQIEELIEGTAPQRSDAGRGSVLDGEALRTEVLDSGRQTDPAVQKAFEAGLSGNSQRALSNEDARVVFASLGPRIETAPWQDYEDARLDLWRRTDVDARVRSILRDLDHVSEIDPESTKRLWQTHAPRDRAIPRELEQLVSERTAAQDRPNAERVFEGLGPRIASAPWKEFDAPGFDPWKQPEVAEAVWSVQRALEAAARVDPERARRVWIEHAPDQRPLPRDVDDLVRSVARERAVQPITDTGIGASPPTPAQAPQPVPEAVVDIDREMQAGDWARLSGARPTALVNAIERIAEPERAADDAATARLRTRLEEHASALPAREHERADDARERVAVARETVSLMSSGQLRAHAANATRTPAETETALREVRAQLETTADATRRAPVPPLTDRFHIVQHPSRRDYEFRGTAGGVAFTERWLSMQTRLESAAVAKGMVDRALERGWTSIRVRGTPEFQRQAWIAAQARGITAVGYEATPADREAVKLEAARVARDRDRPQPETGGGSITREGSRDREPPAAHSHAAVHAALDRALNESGIAPQQRERVRVAVDRELARRSTRGIETPVRVYDPAAPRETPRPATPVRRRAEPERAR